MYYAFIDESERGTSYFFLTALLVKEENLRILNAELDDLVYRASQGHTSAALLPTAELHGYDMMQQKHDWKGQPLRFCVSVYRQALEIASSYASAIYTEGINRRVLEQRYLVPHDPRDLAFGFILERVNEYCSDKGETASVILDNHYTEPAGRKNFVRYKQEGTFGYRSSRLPLINDIDFRDSRSIRALQASDLCCYAINRSCTCRDTNAKSVRTQEVFMGAIAPLVHRGRVRVWP